VIHPGMTGTVHLCLGNMDRTGPGGDMPGPIGASGVPQTGQQLGAKTNPFIGTRARLIKQVPLGQKAAGVALLHVPVSARLAGRHTPSHKGRGDATVFFNVGMYTLKTHRRGCRCLRVFRFRDSWSQQRSGMRSLWLTHIQL